MKIAQMSIVNQTQIPVSLSQILIIVNRQNQIPIVGQWLPVPQ